MTNADKGMRFFSIIMAFQHFAGKSLKVTDAANAATYAGITREQMNAIIKQVFKHD